MLCVWLKPNTVLFIIRSWFSLWPLFGACLNSGRKGVEWNSSGQLSLQRKRVCISSRFMLNYSFPFFLGNKCPEKDMQLSNKHMRRCSSVPGIKEMQMKTTMWYCYTPVKMITTKIRIMSNAGQDAEKKMAYLCTFVLLVNGNTKWIIPFKKKNLSIFCKAKLVLTILSKTIELLRIYPREMKLMFNQKSAHKQ